MSKTVSVRVQTATRTKAAGQRAHDLRLGAQPGYVDPARSADNQVLVEPPTPDQLADECQQRRHARWQAGGLKSKKGPGKLRDNAAVAIEGIITFGTEAQAAINDLPAEEQAQRYQQAAEAIAEDLGTTVAGLVIHRDESAPHAHFTLPGYTTAGEPVSGALKRNKLSELQDLAAEKYGDLGIERGEKRSTREARGDDESTYIHRSVQELHRDLPAEVEQAREKVAEMAHRVAETKRKLDEGAKDEAKLKKRLSAYEKRLNDRRAELDRLKERVQLPMASRYEIISEERPPWLRWLAPKTRVQEAYPAGEAAEALEQSEAGRMAAQQRTREARAEVEDLREAADWPRAGFPVEPDWGPKKALTGHQKVLYGAICTVGENEIAVKSRGQETTPRQAAAAIYRHAKDEGWPSLVSAASNDERVQRAILDLAATDGALNWIQGIDPAIRAEYERPTSVIPDQPDQGVDHDHTPDDDPTPRI